MVKAVLYPIRAQVVLTEDELDPTRLVSKWWRQTAEPVRVVAYSLAAIVAGAVFVAEPTDFPVAYDPAELGWVQPVSQPVLPPVPLNVGAVTIDPTTLLQRITVDKWFAAASEPLRVRQPLTAAHIPAYFAGDLRYVPSGLQWWQAASEPVRQVPRSLAALLSDGAFVGEPSDFPVVYDPAGLQWFRPAPQPDNDWTPAHTWVYSAHVATVARPLVSQWYQPTSEPVRQVARSLAALVSDGAFVGEPSDFAVPYDPAELGWVQPISEPVRVVTPVNVGASFTIDPTTLLQRITVDKWFRPASEPVWVTPPLTAAHKPFYFAGDLRYVPAGLQWFQPASEPVRQAPRSLAALLSGGVFVAEPSDLPVIYDPAGLEWWRSASEPVPPKRGLLTAIQQASVVDADLLTQPETLHVDRWFQPAGEPVRVVTPINVGAAFVVDPSTLLQRITVDKWFQAASEPIRQTLKSLAALVSDGAFVGEPSDFAEVYDPAGLQWFRPAEHPADTKPSLHVSLQQTFTTDADLLTQPETLHVDRWWRQASEPVWVVRPVNVGASFTVDPTTLLQRITVDKWFAAASEPQRQISRSLAALLADGAFVGEPSDFAVPYDPAELQWWRPASEPVEPAPRLLTANQQASVMDVDLLATGGTPVTLGPPKHEGLLRNVGKFLK